MLVGLTQIKGIGYNFAIAIADTLKIDTNSNIGNLTDANVQAIEKLIQKRTSIIIAHRLTTIRHADKIMVMDKGRILEFGTHDELLQIENGRYRELYEMQFEAVGN